MTTPENRAEEMALEVLDLKDMTAEKAIEIIQVFPPLIDRDWAARAVHVLHKATESAKSMAGKYPEDVERYIPFAEAVAEVKAGAKLDPMTLYFGQKIDGVGEDLIVSSYSTSGIEIMIDGNPTMVRYIGFKHPNDSGDSHGIVGEYPENGVFYFDAETQSYKPFVVGGNQVKRLEFEEDGDAIVVMAEFVSFFASKDAKENAPEAVEIELSPEMIVRRDK